MNANNQLRHHTGTMKYYRTMLAGLFYTDGVQELQEKFECYWFGDIIMSYQPKIKSTLPNLRKQVWHLERFGNSAVVKMIDGHDRNGEILIQQDIPYTDFKPREAMVFVADGVMFLPSED